MTLEGFQDFGPAQLALLARLRRDAGALFADAGYVEVAPPILEPAESYVERSGEDIRARTYVFDDPGGEEVCLRPELTIPVCRLALRAGYAAKKIARLHYWGSVFRYEPLSAGRYRQFHQVGAELIGPVPEKDGDIEIAALAIELARRAGLADLTLRIGDRGLERAVFDAFGLDEAAGFALLAGDGGNAKPANAEAARLSAAVKGLSRGDAVAVLEQFMAAAGIARLGDRSLDEIVERLIARDRAPPPKEARAALAACEEAEGEGVRALDGLAKKLEKLGVDAKAVLDRIANRASALAKNGVAADALRLAARPRRAFAYYTGFHFELWRADKRDAALLGGGGRYDRLIEMLEPGVKAPAIGFALSVEGLAAASKDFAAPLALFAAAPKPRGKKKG